jgi:osmoprotectant transport system ATP-binding protein
LETSVTRTWELEARQLSKRFPDGTYALHDINWQVKQGETMTLIGESGSGKTTLLRLLNRLAEPSSGEVFIQGHPAIHQDPITLRRQLGYVPQDGGLFPHWTIRDNVCLVPQLLQWPIDQQDDRFNTLLALVHLDPGQVANRYPIELSGGQRQRVAVARALAADPPIILLDEPFSALDPLTRHELHEQFLELKTQLHKTMVVITHDIAEAFRLGDRITVLKDGRIHQIGTPQELIDTPATPYVTSLVQHHVGLKKNNVSTIT